MIPKDRPVTGHDLEDLREKLALSVTDLCWLFGLSMPNWGKIKKAGPEPVKDPAVALLARFLDSYPEACPIPRPPEPGDVAERLPELSRKTLGIALGREASAGYRWVVQGGRTSPILNRLLLMVLMLIILIRQEMQWLLAHQQAQFLPIIHSYELID